MRTIASLIVTVFLFTAASFAQFEPCKLGELQSAKNDNGVTIGRATLSEPSGEIGASVFIPAGDGRFPGIIFSHSAIQGQTSRTDLQRFALALARAGAASIVLDGTIEWLNPNDDFKKPEPRTLACAGQWLLSNVKLDRKKLAVAGTLNGWGSGYTAQCRIEADWGKPCFLTHAILNFGTTWHVDWDNTDSMLTLEGQLEMAQFAQRHLGLSKLKPEWLAETPADETAQSGSTY